MKISVLGTGMVGERIATRLAELGNDVMMGSRTADNKTATEWARKNGSRAQCGTFEDAVKFGEIVFLCVKGEAVIEVIRLAKPANFKDKTVIDISNPLDFTRGMPPSLLISNTNSLGEEVQKAIPAARVVKTLNMVSNEIMTAPEKTGGEPTMFVCGNDASAKKQATALLASFGWKDILDLGDISSARGTEMLLPIWLRIWGVLNDGNFAFKIVRKKP